MSNNFNQKVKQVKGLVCVGIIFLMMINFIGCSKGGGGSRPSGGGGGTSSSASDFKYDLTEDGKGIKITGFTGTGSRVSIPAKIEGLPVVEIGDKVFDGKTLSVSGIVGYNTKNAEFSSSENKNAVITSITIPNTVTKIGSSAFANTAITSFTMPDSVTEIGERVFDGTKNLTEVRLSDNLIRIPQWTFQKSGIKKVNLPKNLKEIGAAAFSECENLTDITIPGNISSIRFLDFIFFGKEEEKSDNYAFEGSGKIPIKTRQTIKDWGYTGNF